MQHLHPQAMDFGLERVGAVWQRLGAPPIATRVITVGGTNGKGSTVGYLDAIARAAGLRVGRYTSPHLQRYNERVAVCGIEASDRALIAAFRAIEAARGATTLSYFEYGTLAALLHFADHALDLAVLEVGLGGRLDAVNLIDADVAVLTTIDLDHCEYLGPTRAHIAFEKAHIGRPGRPLLLGDRNPPELLAVSGRHPRFGFVESRLGVDFDHRDGHWHGPEPRLHGLRLPKLKLSGAHQHDNAALAIAAIAALDWAAIKPMHVALGLAAANVPGRLTTVDWAGRQWLIDVAHNPQSARALANHLRAGGSTARTRLIIGVLADKDTPAIAEPLATVAEEVCVVGIADPRGDDGRRLAAAFAALGVTVGREDSVEAALERALASPELARVVVAGSFHVAGPALTWLERVRSKTV